MLDSLLSHIDKYVDLSDRERDFLSEGLKFIKLDKNEVLHLAGKRCNARYFVAKGCLYSHFSNTQGKEQILQFAIENWWIADYESLEQGIVSDLSIQAVERTEVIALEKKEEEELFQEIPKLERYFRLVQERDRTAAWTKIKYMHSLTKKEFYKHFQESFPDFIERVPDYMIASYLGFTPEYMSRIRRKILS